ncbi:nucleoside monophosphate kinase [Longispora albida]|uniref:nucleoside monophosphate kinase n=1 Tax=Longispora albida TaxID=203523 RepID=UPI0003A46BD4|nr:nucleoside monophosphate kinase [Longispora albida]
MAEPRQLLITPVTGPPGAGKTTALLSLDQQHPWLARFGVRDYGLYLSSIGDPLGLELRDTLLKQELLSNELVLREFVHFLQRVPSSVLAVAVEGYPRDLAQCHDFAQAVQSAGARMAAFVFIEVPDSVARARVAVRRLCLACGLPLDLAVTGACLDCGGPAGRRGDDDTRRFEQRLAEYREVSAPVREHFAERGHLRTVDGQQSSAQVRETLTALLSAGRNLEPEKRATMVSGGSLA